MRTFFLLVYNTRCFLFFLYARAFLLSTDLQGIASLLSLNKAKVGASPLPSQKFMRVTQVLYCLLPTFLSFIFIFNSFLSSSFFLVSIFSICSFQFSFMSFFLKISFIHLHICVCHHDGVLISLCLTFPLQTSKRRHYRGNFF